jgi:RND superfamily putative drug exporter
MLAWWSNRVVPWRRRILGIAVVCIAFAGIWGTGVFKDLVDGGFDDTHNESSRAAQLLEDRIGRTDADLILLVSHPTRTVDDPKFEADVQWALAQIPAEQVARTATYWSTHAQNMVTVDHRSTYAVVTLVEPDEPRKISSYDPMKSVLTERGYEAKLGGTSAVNDDINQRVKEDIARAESISLPLLMVLLVIIFGSVVAGSMTLLVGVIAILGAFTALRVISFFTDVSVFAINIVTIAGLGLAIDYGLFIVSRFREELAAGHSTEEATRRTVLTAGRTVAVSAVTVAVALSGLILFPQGFLRSMGFGGIAAVLIAAVGAVVVLPAVLAMLGPRIERLPVRRRNRKARPAEDNSGFWFKLANSVMRRPGRYLFVSVLILGSMAVPFLHVKFGGFDARMLPADAEVRQVATTLNTDFPGSNPRPIVAAVTLAEPVGSAPGRAALQALVTEMKQLPGASGALVGAVEGHTARIDVGYAGDALDSSVKSLVKTVRSAPYPPGVKEVLVGGETALLVDRLDSIGDRLPLMALLVGLATFVLLFFAFGSVLLPLKAILLNFLSLAASFGVVTWIFQNGHLAGLLNFTPTGTVEATQPILVLAIVFGLSMDYEVFLLSRIREQYDLTGNNRLAVAAGLQRTGSIITSAALLIVVVIGAFSASSITFIKLIGVAMATAIIVDAVIVRSIVVPATMRLFGDANWWVPKPLERLYRRYGIREDSISEKVPPSEHQSSSR